MIFEDKQKEELIKVEVELIVLSFKISDKIGQTATETALSNFYNYMCRGLGKERFLASMNMEYRKFVIDLTKALPVDVLAKAMVSILGVRNV